MGRDKALLPWPKAEDGATGKLGGQGTLLSAGIRALSEVCDFVTVVAGQNEDALRPMVYACGAFLVRNPAPERGQFSSLQTGLQDVLNRGRSDAMVTLVDRPPPSGETLTALVNAFIERKHGTWAVVPDHEGKHGHPILIGREMIEALLTAPAAATAREIEHANQQRIAYVATGDAMVTANIDTPEQYAGIE
jgi:CTP:molybdopterin cytidylyltransferase MocA